MGRLGRFSTLLVLALALAMTWVLPALAADRVPVGRVIRQEGGASVLRDAVRSPLLPGTAVFAGDVVETAASSRVTLRFEDDSTLTAGPSSRVAVSEYVVTPAAGGPAHCSRCWPGSSGPPSSRRVSAASPSRPKTPSPRPAPPNGRSRSCPPAPPSSGSRAPSRSPAAGRELPSRSTPARGPTSLPAPAPTPPVTWGAPRVERTLSLVGPAIR